MQMLRIGDSSMINQTGSKLLHKAMPLQVSSLLPEPINLGDMQQAKSQYNITRFIKGPVRTMRMVLSPAHYAE